jgi:hypothetical protein
MDVRKVVGVSVLSLGMGLGMIAGLGACASGPEGGDDDAPGAACSALTGIPAGTDPTVIDDLEDGDEGIAENGARVGSWYSFNDGTAGGTQSPAEADDFKPAGVEGACGMFAARTSGKGFKEWGAGIGLDLNAPPPATVGGPEIKKAYDASAYTGIAFEAKGNVGISVGVAEIATLPMADGGSCTPSTVEGMECEDNHSKTIALGSDWKTYKIDFSTLKQEGFGKAVPFDAKTITGIQFSVAQNLEFDFSVDNVRFY